MANQMFKGLLNNNQSDYHSFSTDDPKAHKIGIIAYSLSSLPDYLSNIEEKVTKVFNCDGDGGLDDLKDKLLGVPQDVVGKYYVFKPETGKYEETEYTESLKDLAEAHDSSQLFGDPPANLLDKVEVIKDVQKSLHGCIEFKPFGDGEEDPVYKLHFQDRSKRNNARDLALNGDPKISSVPRIPTGKKYHFGITKKQTDKDNVGVYKVAEKSVFDIESSDLEARVAAKLRLSYNEGLGCFESGSQIILARLLQNLDPAPIAEIDVDTLDGVSSEDLYNPDSPYYTSQFSTGVAIPMTVHGGNPNTFGPNIINKDSKKKEKIRVVNRAAKSFKKNDVVVCMLIDNEWIVMDFGEQTLEPPGVKLGKWSFTKMLVNTDSFLLDDRYFTRGPDAGYSSFKQEERYQTDMRVMFYRDLNNSFANQELTQGGLNNINLLAKLNALPDSALEDVDVNAAAFPDNIDDIDFEPSSRYIQTSSFDMVGSTVGGSNEYGSIIGRTHRSINNDSSIASVAEYISDLGLWWGTNFSEGFAAGKTISIKGKSIPVEYNGNTKFFGDAASLDISDTSDEANKSKTGSMFDDTFDFNLYQLPADIGLNASISGQYGTPIESLSLLSQYEQSSDNFATLYNDFRFDEKRYSWISKQGDAADSFYDLEPVTKTKLQLIPLTWAYVENSGDAFSTLSGIPEYEQLWGGMYDRESELTTHDFESGIPWDYGVTHPPLLKPLQSVRRFSDPPSLGGANLIGINAFKNTVRIGGGASIQFDTGFSYGLPQYTTVTGGQVTPPTILPLGGGIAFGGGTNAIRTFGFPQWGRNNNILSGMWGSARLLIKVYDHWPEEDTIYDVRYFQPLHFGAGKLGTRASTNTLDEGVVANIEEWSPGADDFSDASIKYERAVDNIDYPGFDFRVPTYAHPTDQGVDNSPVPVDTIINARGAGGSADLSSTTNILRRKDEWKVNTIARGMMLSENFGFRYLRRTIGLNKNDITVLVEADLPEGVEFEDSSNGWKIKIKSAGTISAESIEFVDQGFDFTPSAFSSSVQNPDNPDDPLDRLYGKVLTLGDAQIMVHTGIVYDRLEETNYPKKQGSVNCLPDEGPDPLLQTGNRSSTIGVSKPNDTNLYDMFFFYANDVGHVDLVPQIQTAGFLQFVDLTIGAA